MDEIEPGRHTEAELVAALNKIAEISVASIHSHEFLMSNPSKHMGVYRIQEALRDLTGRWPGSRA